MTKWWNEVDFPITVCNKDGIILEMNQASIRNFAKDGGASLIGKSLLDCHPEPARQILSNMLLTRTPHTYKSSKANRLVRQFPWYQDDVYMGFVEMLIPLPDDLQLTKRESLIYHIALRDEWNKGIENGVYTPSGFSVDHFIHCSTQEQVLLVAGKYYQNTQGLVLLRIQPSRLVSELVYENLEGGVDLFPHIYGALNLEAVTEVKNLQKDSDGNYIFPF